jgi:ArsR family transcriptional regulator
MENLNILMIKFLKVLSDPTRLEIIDYLKDNFSTAGEIQNKLNLSQSYTSHQLKKLVDVDIVTYNKLGKKKIFKIKNKEIYKLISLIKSYILQLEKEKIQQIRSLEQSESIPKFKDFF